MAHLIPAGKIESRILLLRGQKVLLDSDLANLYGVTTKALNQAAKRNLRRFPPDFMFQLNTGEVRVLRSQIVTSNGRRGGRRFRPYAFTEHGVAMLASVLKSERAIQVNIAIVRAFVRLREFLATHEELAKKLARLERKYDARFQAVFEAIRQLMFSSEEKAKRKMGFVKEV
jgi:hypothetical protein